jgi:hypothetical protein
MPAFNIDSAGEAANAYPAEGSLLKQQSQPRSQDEDLKHRGHSVAEPWKDFNLAGAIVLKFPGNGSNILMELLRGDPSLGLFQQGKQVRNSKELVHSNEHAA